MNRIERSCLIFFLLRVSSFLSWLPSKHCNVYHKPANKLDVNGYVVLPSLYSSKQGPRRTWMSSTAISPRWPDPTPASRIIWTKEWTLFNDNRDARYKTSFVWGMIWFSRLLPVSYHRHSKFHRISVVSSGSNTGFRQSIWELMKLSSMTKTR